MSIPKKRISLNGVLQLLFTLFTFIQQVIIPVLKSELNHVTKSYLKLRHNYCWIVIFWKDTYFWSKASCRWATDCTSGVWVRSSCEALCESILLTYAAGTKPCLSFVSTFHQSCKKHIYFTAKLMLPQWHFTNQVLVKSNNYWYFFPHYLLSRSHKRCINVPA